MKTYEYKKLYFEYGGFTGSIEKLDQLGKEGWQVVDINRTPTKVEYLFIREIEEKLENKEPQC